MPVIRLSRWFPTLLVVFVVAFGCTPNANQPTGGGGRPQYLAEDLAARKAPWCMQGNGSRNNPLICVDPATLTANPHTASIWDVEEDGNGHPTNRPVRIVWQARTNANLGIKFEKKGCVTNLFCHGPVCTAFAAPLPAPGGIKTPRPKEDCKYSINVNGEVVDPDLEINPCCM